MKFRRRSEIVNAIRYNEDNSPKVLAFLLDGHADYNHLPSCRPDGKKGISVGVADGRISVPTTDGMTFCRFGDWIVKTEKGKFLTMKNAAFEEIYEPAVIEAEATA